VLDPLEPGRYTYSAETIIGQDRHVKQGQIHVLAVNLEDLFTTADHKVLEQLAEDKQGQFYAENQYDELLSFATSLEPGEESTRIESRWTDLLQLKFLLFFIVFLLTLEWLLRRWFGTR